MRVFPKKKISILGMRHAHIKSPRRGSDDLRPEWWTVFPGVIDGHGICCAIVYNLAFGIGSKHGMNEHRRLYPPLRNLNFEAKPYAFCILPLLSNIPSPSWCWRFPLHSTQCSRNTFSDVKTSSRMLGRNSRREKSYQIAFLDD
jgi:hypothetical protein